MIVAAVQVRMGSTRLPQKALSDVLGQPMLCHIVNRVRSAKRVNRVVIATSHEPGDEPIRDLAEKLNIPCFAGSESDLLDRLHQTASHFEARALVRITGDCPLVDPQIVDDLLAKYLTQADRIDYACNVLPPTYPDGLDVEIYPVTTLERLCAEITDPFWREWFPSYLWERRDEFRILNLAYPINLSALRWTVDYQEDLRFMREVFRRLQGEAEPFGMEKVLELLEAQPELAAINARHSRNEGMEGALNAYRKLQKRG